MVVGLLGNKSPDSNRFTLVTPKPENGVRLQATLGNQNPTGLPVGAVSVVCDNPDYIKRYGRKNNIESEKLYKFMSEVSEWCERELDEDCSFKVD